MAGKVIIGARTTPENRLAVHAYAALQGKTVSQLIQERVIDRAVKPLLAAAEVEHGELHALAE